MSEILSSSELGVLTDFIDEDYGILGLTGNYKRVLTKILKLYNNTQNVYCTNYWLHERLTVSISTVEKAIKALKDIGVITTKSVIIRTTSGTKKQRTIFCHIDKIEAYRQTLLNKAKKAKEVIVETAQQAVEEVKETLKEVKETLQNTVQKGREVINKVQQKAKETPKSTTQKQEKVQIELNFRGKKYKIEKSKLYAPVEVYFNNKKYDVSGITALDQMLETKWKDTCFEWLRHWESSETIKDFNHFINLTRKAFAHFYVWSDRKPNIVSHHIKHSLEVGKPFAMKS